MVKTDERFSECQAGSLWAVRRYLSENVEAIVKAMRLSAYLADAIIDRALSRIDLLRPCFSSKSAMKAFVHAIVKHCAVDEIRRFKLGRANELGDSNLLEDCASSLSPDASSQMNELWSALQEFRAGLSEFDMQVFDLCLHLAVAAPSKSERGALVRTFAKNHACTRRHVNAQIVTMVKRIRSFLDRRGLA